MGFQSKSDVCYDVMKGQRLSMTTSSLSISLIGYFYCILNEGLFPIFIALFGKSIVMVNVYFLGRIL